MTWTLLQCVNWLTAHQAQCSGVQWSLDGRPHACQHMAWQHLCFSYVKGENVDFFGLAWSGLAFWFLPIVMQMALIMAVMFNRSISQSKHVASHVLNESEVRVAVDPVVVDCV